MHTISYLDPSLPSLPGPQTEEKHGTQIALRTANRATVEQILFVQPGVLFASAPLRH